MHAANTVAVDGHGLLFAQNREPGLSRRRGILSAASGHRPLCVTAAPRLGRKYGDHVNRLHDCG